MKNKFDLRREMRCLRDEIPIITREEWSRRIGENAAAAIPSGATVMAYSAIGSEADPAPLVRLLRQKDCRICLPVARGGGRMDAALWEEGMHMQPDRYGISAPAQEILIPPAEIDFVIVPGLAFDRNGGRLGYGGGYYDRFLAHCGAATLAVGYRMQLVEAVPVSTWDRKMDFFADEHGLRQIGREFR